MEGCAVLVVDDEPTIRHILERRLTSQGYEVTCASSAEEALALLPTVQPAVVLIDIIMPGMTGLEALPRIKAEPCNPEVIVMTSHGSMEASVDAIQKGAYDYLEKPFDDIDDVWITVRRAQEKRCLASDNESLVWEKEQRNRELALAVARLTSIVDAGRVLSGLDSVQELLEFFVSYLTQRLEVDRASLMLLDSVGNELTIACHRGLADVDPASVKVEVGEGIAGSVAESGEPFLVTDASSDERVADRTRADLSSSFISAPIVLSAPLKSGDKVLGVLNLTNQRNGDPFTEEDLAYIMALGSHLAVAVEKARKLEELEEAYGSLKTTQEQLALSDRLKSIGQMAGGVARDFNNLLSVIAGRAELSRLSLQTRQPDLESVLQHLETITKTALEGAKVVERMLNFTRAPDDDRVVGPVDVNDAIQQAVEMTRPKWKQESEAHDRPVKVSYELGEVRRLNASAQEITQVIGNLIFNAVEAMPQGGKLTFRTRQEHDRVVLEVEDTGVGMDPDTQTRMFEPFFTTKTDGQGLGATTLRGIVHRHRGEIAVKSDPGEGTRVTVRFPVLAETAPAEVTPSVLGPTRPAQVLLIDDDEVVRDTYRGALESGGHRVLPACSGPQGLQFMQHMKFDLVVTDLSMDEMSGLEVTKQIKARHPGTPVALLSGWITDNVEQRGREAGVDYVLKKPCTFDKLLAVVRHALDGDREGAPPLC